MSNGWRCFGVISLLYSFQYLVLSISDSHVYIAYLGHTQNQDPFLTSDYHVQLLANVFKSKEEANRAILYSYKQAFSGFAATLNESQATVLANTKGVISVFKSKVMELHTTRSWDFMGLTLDNSHGTPLQLAHGDNIIVGVIDSGVWPESASFMEDPDMGPVPKSWKGRCVSGEEFNPKKACNKKLIGARYYLKGFEKEHGKINTTDLEYRSTRDSAGHGSHTASTAVGSRSTNASIFGFAAGTARGGAPRARLAVYKACWHKDGTASCTEEDVLAAFDDALNDGVHVISVSSGPGPPLDSFFVHAHDIGSFHAMQLGVSVVFSAGNIGPDPSLVRNVNPWSICVGASKMDRSFPTKLLLDDGTSFVGEGLITNHLSGVLETSEAYFDNGNCDSENWNNISASGKILLCFSTDGSTSESAGNAAFIANALALIYVQPLTSPIATVHIIPIVSIDIIQGTKLKLNSNFTKVQILPSETAFKRLPAPVVSDYSSRGPSSISPDFLKPDISAPGTNVLAAWPSNIPPTIIPGDDRSVKWNMITGTSIACPHVSGVVALLKSAHPQWSPAAIRSALMTTAYNTDIAGDGILVEASTKSSDPFDVGAGHMNPVRAFEPGLIYDMSIRDYVVFLCNNGYSDEQIRAMVITCQPKTCPRCSHQKLEPDWNINYPSITVSNLKYATKVKRTVRYVGLAKTATYHVSTVNPNGVDVSVWPTILTFSASIKEKTYYVTLNPLKKSQGRYDFGSIIWSDGFHQVRSPLVVQVNTLSANDEV